MNTNPDRWRRIEELCQAALERDASERGAFLTTSCGEDDELRREVESLLRREPRAEQFLDQRAREVMLKRAAGGLPASSMIGRRLGVYQVVGHLGAGGMGDVYRARDTKLGRDVAIKVLPSIFAADPERLARFEREARILAALNQPHIAAIYGVEESEGVRALVLELVEGPTLADRLASGPLPINEALVIARQLAEALQAAHERGIVHRDLKPANIKFSRDGVVKVLDFGLAKAIVGDAPGSDPTQSPTVSAGVTGEGLVLGTVGYMSPEQATGRPTDKRTDVWAFGCVLFEMLTGRRAFEGRDAGDTFAAVFVREPDWEALQHEPIAIRRLLQRCLERDPHQRIADFAAVRFVLEEAGNLGSTTGARDPAAANAASRAMWRRVAIFGGITLVVGAAVGTGLMRLVTQPVPAAVTRTMIAMSPPVALTIDVEVRDFAVSADGGRVVVVYVGNNSTQLFVRALDRLEPVAIVTGQRVGNPFVSPDGQWVGFFENGSTLKKVSITGGPPITLAQIAGTGPRGATWVSDDAIVVATSNASGLWLIPLGGGGPVSLTQPDRARGEAEHIWPERLPGGHLVLFTITAQTGGLDAAQVAVFDLRTRTYKVLFRGGSDAQYVPSGHLLYVASGTLRAVPFDLSRLDVPGTGVQVVPRVLTTPAGASDSAVSGDTLIYVDAPGHAQSDIKRTLTWVDRTGREDPIVGAPAQSYIFPRLSPDGTHLALDIVGQERGLWIWDFQRANLTRLTTDSAFNRVPEWTRDGKRIVYTSNRGGVDNLWWQAADGSGVPEQLLTSRNTQLACGSTPDGAMIFADRAPSTHEENLMLLALDGSHRVSPVLQTASDERNGVVSPDGRWIAYESDSSGQFEIYVRPFPDTSSGQWPVSSGGGTRPLWSKNGRELYYVASTPLAPLMRVSVETRGATFRPSRPVVLLEGYAVTNPSRTYDVAADGRFVMIKPPAPGQTEQPSLIIVQHWAEELKRLVPTK